MRIFNVDRLTDMAKKFGGGGHKKAAGGPTAAGKKKALSARYQAWGCSCRLAATW